MKKERSQKWFIVTLSFMLWNWNYNWYINMSYDILNMLHVFYRRIVVRIFNLSIAQKRIRSEHGVCIVGRTERRNKIVINRWIFGRSGQKGAGKRFAAKLSKDIDRAVQIFAGGKDNRKRNGNGLENLSGRTGVTICHSKHVYVCVEQFPSISGP